MSRAVRVASGRVRRVLVAAAIGLVVLGAAVTLGATGLVARLTGSISGHADGDGALGSIGRPGYESMTVPQAHAGSITYGIRLCAADVHVPATIESVGPATPVGSGFRTIGILAREFLPTETHTPIISVEGFPPPARYVPDPVAPAPGFVVRTSCDNGPTDSYTEMLVGLGVTGPDGGGWRGIDIRYRADGREWLLHLDHDLLICGQSVTEGCEPPSSSAAP
jgi:hypothetical protein